MNNHNTIVIQALVLRLVFQNEENYYTVAKIELKGEEGVEQVCVGTLPLVQAGVRIEAEGYWVQNPRFGKQFEILSFEVPRPKTLTEMEGYLGSGLIKGLRRKYAARIVNHFGFETFDVLDQEPKRLEEVPKLPKQKIPDIISSWQELQELRNLILFLQKYDIAPNWASKIYKEYGQASQARILKNPYQLYRDIDGIGFIKADAIAIQIGLDPEAEARIESGLHYILQKNAQQDGHTCMPKESLISQCASLLKIDQNLIEIGLSKGIAQKKFQLETIKKQDFIWEKLLYLQEQSIVENLHALLDQTDPLKEIQADWVKACENLSIQLSKEQAQALELIWKNKAQILTGGPGTGKTTITKVLILALKAAGISVLVAAPTGRAAKRLTEITGHKAQTIHSLLEYDFYRGFQRNLNNPLDTQVLIIDEASMLDTPLFYHLLEALPIQAKLVLIGDVDQLPSVGPGRILADLIEMEILPIVRLREIFRQARYSQIITQAHALNQGYKQLFRNGRRDDCFFIPLDTEDEIVRCLIDLVQRRLPLAYGFNPKRDIQILAPMRNGTLGTHNLNRLLQRQYFPQLKPDLQRGNQTWFVGDKVIQIKNDYDKNVFNGDIGLIEKIQDQTVYVRMNEEEQSVEYSFKDLDNLEQAYAITIHKYQGSEAPCVIIPLHLNQQFMLTRNLLYTALTRGRKLVILLGQKRAWDLAVENRFARTRFSGIPHFWRNPKTLQLPRIQILDLPTIQKAQQQNDQTWTWIDS